MCVCVFDQLPLASFCKMSGDIRLKGGGVWRLWGLSVCLLLGAVCSVYVCVRVKARRRALYIQAVADAKRGPRFSLNGDPKRVSRAARMRGALRPTYRNSGNVARKYDITANQRRRYGMVRPMCRRLSLVNRRSPWYFYQTILSNGLWLVKCGLINNSANHNSLCRGVSIGPMLNCIEYEIYCWRHNLCHLNL